MVGFKANATHCKQAGKQAGRHQSFSGMQHAVPLTPLTTRSGQCSTHTAHCRLHPAASPRPRPKPFTRPRQPRTAHTLMRTLGRVTLGRPRASRGPPEHDSTGHARTPLLRPEAAPGPWRVQEGAGRQPCVQGKRRGKWAGLAPVCSMSGQSVHACKRFVAAPSSRHTSASLMLRWHRCLSPCCARPSICHTLAPHLPASCAAACVARARAPLV